MTFRTRRYHLRRAKRCASMYLRDSSGARSHPERREHTVAGFWFHLKQAVALERQR